MTENHLDLTHSWFGYVSVAIFLLSYVLVIFEEVIHLRKSKPVLLAAGLIWLLIGWAYTLAGHSEVAEVAAQHVIFEYGELFLFLLVAITYVNTLEERRVFEVLRAKLTARTVTSSNPVSLIVLSSTLVSPSENRGSGVLPKR